MVFTLTEKNLVHELQDGDLINFGCEVNASYHHYAKNFLSEGSNYKPESSLIFNAEVTLAEQSYVDEITQLPNEILYQEYLSF
jgi:hypothetical protein